VSLCPRIINDTGYSDRIKKECNPIFNSFDIFIVTAVNYADRATLSIAGTEVAKELGLSAVEMGYIFSAFGWAYLLMQIPGGWLLDKFGSKKVYTYSLFFWSLFTFLQGFVGYVPAGVGGHLNVLYALYAGLLRSAFFPGKRPYRGGLVSDQRARHRIGDL
jgi:MFS family permease